MELSLTWKDRLFSLSNGGLLILFSLAMVFPIYYTIVLSFTDPTEYYTRDLILWPHHWSLDAYRYLLGNGLFVNSVLISLFLATVGTLLSLLVTGGLAYAISVRRLRFRKTMMVMILITFLFTPGLVPLYMVVRNLGLIDSVWSLILPSLTSGWYVLLMKAFSTASRTAWKRPRGSTAAPKSACSGGLSFRCRCRRWSLSGCFCGGVLEHLFQRDHVHE